MKGRRLVPPGITAARRRALRAPGPAWTIPNRAPTRETPNHRLGSDCVETVDALSVLPRQFARGVALWRVYKPKPAAHRYRSNQQDGSCRIALPRSLA